MTSRAAAVLAAAGVLLVLPLPPHIVERAYSRGLYAVLQPLVTTLSNRAPFALGDAIMVSVAAAWLALGARDLVRHRPPDLVRHRLPTAAARVAVRSLVWAAAAYLLFLVFWGFNYRRVRLVDRLEFDATAVTEEAATELAATSVHELNTLHRPAHAQGWPVARTIDPVLEGAFNRVVRDLGSSRVVVGRPKRTVFDWYLRRTGVEGIIDPFALETIVAIDLLPFERPFVLAHEWGHLAGLTDEGEANFVGWLTCMRGSPADQYSGWIFLHDALVRAVRVEKRGALVARLDQGPREDLRAIRDRIAGHVSPRMSAAAWRLYDSYLKANRVEAGAASYADVIKLALGVRLPKR